MGGGARGFSPLKGKKCWGKNLNYKGIIPSTQGIQVRTHRTNALWLVLYSSRGRWRDATVKGLTLGGKSRSFTLTEVLITLGIIGVVAAMTLPTLISKHNKLVNQTRLKKFNSMMAQAVIITEELNNEVINDQIPRESDASEVEAWFLKYLAPHIKYKKAEVSVDPTRHVKVYLYDNSSMSIWKANCVEVYFDVNADKKPNKMGYDQFNFMICSNSEESKVWSDGRHWGAYYNASQDTRTKRLEACKDNARFCSGLLEYDNWEFKDDYPWQ